MAKEEISEKGEEMRCPECGAPYYAECEHMRKQGVEATEEGPKLTEETRFKIDQHVDFSAKDFKKAETEGNRKEIIKEFEDHLEFVSPEGIKNRDLHEERLREYIREREEHLIKAAEMVDRRPGILGKSLKFEDIGKMSKRFTLDVEKNPSYDKWSLVVKLIKAKEKRDIVEGMFGKKIDEILAREKKKE